jgi:cellulose synthase/poly-beta-1,6-N-acetylglucosamine synthase-like glycosyltransferase
VPFSAVITAAAHIIVWACGLLVIYVWLGYPAVLWTLTRLFRRRERALPPAGESTPSVTVIVAVHNEEAALPGKLENCLRLLYPRDRLRVVVASDGSTDGTLHIANEFARRHPGLRVWAQQDRVGKTVTQNVAVRLAEGEILLFSDVDTELDAHFLEHIVRPFADGKVGCVAGLLTWTNPDASAVAAGGDFYWRYEHVIWRMESRLGLLAWANGACLAVRRELFTPMEAQYGEDTVVPLDVVAQGYRVVFQPEAIASDERTVGAGAEMRARVRMTLRSFTGTLSRKHLLNPWRFPQVAWAILSHKLLRWLVPYFLVLGFVSNVLLLGRGGVYPYSLALQVIFYVSGAIGYFLDQRDIRLRFFSIIYAFCLMNLGVAVGVAQAILGRRILAYRSEG